MSFSHLIGHPYIKDYLSTLLTRSVFPQVMLFYGLKGVGKSSFAKACAKQLLNNQAKVDSGNHPDLHLFVPQGKSALHSIETIREIIDKAYLPPYEANTSVFIVEEVERMLPASANALLKLLEEPPPHCYFFMIAEDIDKMLPTILSRCQKVAFHPLGKDLIEAYLKANNPDCSHIHSIALQSQGSIQEALKLCHKGVRKDVRKQLLQLLSYPLDTHYAESLDLIEKLQSLQKESQEEEMKSFSEEVLEDMLACFRDLYLLKAKGKKELLFFPDEIEFLEKIMPLYNLPFEGVFSLFTEAYHQLDYNVRLATLLESILLRTQKIVV